MKDESESITDDEWLYRRVHRDKFRSDGAPLISPSAFEPRTGGRDPDDDGISLFRADCVESADAILCLIEDPVKRAANGIVAVTVGEVRSLGLTIENTARPEILGHVSIPEMSAAAMKTEDGRKKCKKWMFELATLASPNNRIILRPVIDDAQG